MNIGDKVRFYFKDRQGNIFLLFEGNVFLQNRNSDSYSMEFKAYDNLIYLAKSEVQMKFSNVAAKEIIGRVCSALGVTLGKVHDDFNVTCDFIADGMTGTEVIKKCIERCEAQYGWRYKAVMLDDGNGQQVLNVVRADNSDENVVANFKLTDKTNIMRARHGSSIEDMVNQVAVVNDNGDITGYIKLEEEIAKYGLIQKVYKYNQKENSETAAKLMLQKVKEHSELSAIGHIECISGYVVEIEEEQITGKFMIISDRHRFQNNQHEMELTLDYIVKPDNRVGATTEGNVNPAPTKKKGKGSKSTKVGLKDGINAFKGASYTPDPANGCAWAATGIASYYSPWAAEQHNNGVYYVPDLVKNAGDMYVPYSEGTLEPGDIIVYGDNDHVVVATGGHGYAGNSTKKGKVVEGKDFTSMGGLYPSGIIKTSRG